MIPQGHPAARATALDALRGFAILAMVLVALQPSTVLPPWMYHAQTPPPSHELIPKLNGLTWPDVVFPIFLVALGAAIPFALGRRLDAGESRRRIVLSVVLRGGLLLFFAVFRQHFDASVSPLEPLWLRHVLALTGFIALFGIFTRFPSVWSPRLRGAVRAASWALALVMLLLVRFPDGTGASLARADYILKALAHAVVWGSLVWMFTRRNMALRLGIMAAVVAFRVAAWRGGWADTLWNLTSFEAPVHVGFVVYLCAVIPGTIVGDAMAARRAGDEGLLRSLTGWSACWIVVGLAFAFGHAGINKIEGTPSWFFTTAGLSIVVLMVLIAVVDVLRKPQAVGLLVDNGQNPMIGYVANGMLLLPLLGLTGLKDRLEGVTTSPTLGFARALFLTLLVAFLVRFFSRNRLYWRT